MFSPPTRLSSYITSYILNQTTGEPYIVSVIGSGGKTSTIELITKSLLQRGKRVLILTTTHMAHPIHHHYPFDVYIADEKEREIPTKWKLKQALLVATHSQDKVGPVSSEVMNNLFPNYDIILIESDGARNMNLKYHRSDEPVVIDKTHLVLKVVGIASLHHNVCEQVHNSSQFLKEYPTKKGLVTYELIHFLTFLHKQIEDTKSIFLYNQSDALRVGEVDELINEGIPYFERANNLVLVGSVQKDRIDYSNYKEIES